MIIVDSFKRPSRSIVSEFDELFSGAISDAMNLAGAMVSEIKPIFDEIKIVGSAITVATHVGDTLTLVKAIDLTQPGDVIVIDGRGHKDSAIWGGLMARSAMKKGVVGVVVDGAARDVAEIRQLKFPVFARAIVPNNGTAGYLGKINVPIQCGGVTVRPGDIIFGDDDGVVVIPQELAEEVSKTAQSIIREEEETLSKIESGLSYGQIVGVDKIIEQIEK
jgi:regulator of RNase E activity RraA